MSIWGWQRLGMVHFSFSKELPYQNSRETLKTDSACFQMHWGPEYLFTLYHVYRFEVQSATGRTELSLTRSAEGASVPSRRFGYLGVLPNRAVPWHARAMMVSDMVARFRLSHEWLHIPRSCRLLPLRIVSAVLMA